MSDALSLSLMRENEHSPALMTTIMRSIHVHVPALMTTIMRHKLINECTRPTQHIINVKKNIKETVNIALSI